MRLRPILFAIVALLAAAVPATASAASVPEGADWSQATFPSSGGVTLHADVLRPKGLAPTDRTPVILSIGPYFNHSGQTGPAGPAEDTSYDPVGPAGPSDRFNDFVEGAKLMERGYTFVMVDLRGFGGSSGCLDWAGPGEQSDVVNAVKWAASQPWSTGRVGMYGKSYDGVTGLIGANHHPDGLDAVVSQEPVYDLYRYLYGDGMRRLNSVLTPALYDLIDMTPGPATDDPNYNLNGLDDHQRPGCPVVNWYDQAGNDDHYSDYWRQRNLIPGAKSSSVPLFLTQGLTENNTVADGTAQYLQNHQGYERGWLGPWEHVRGNERDENGRLKMGREGWFDEVMRFYDRFLKGATPSVTDPQFAVQTNDGRWRAEDQWPPADAVNYTSNLRRAATTTTDRAPRPATTPRACGRSPRVSRTTPTWPAPAGRSWTWRRPGRTPTSWSTSTTSTSTASARSSRARASSCARAARRRSTCGRRTGSSRRGTGSPCESPTRTRTGGCTPRCSTP